MQILRGDLLPFDFSFGYFFGNPPANRSDLSFQISKAGFPGIGTDNGLKGLFIKAKVFFSQAVFLYLFGDQMFMSDLDLFFFNITGQIQDLHAIP